MPDREPLLVRDCPSCGGEGCFYEARPFHDDPYFEVAVPCGECHGVGLVEGMPEPVTQDDMDEMEAEEDAATPGPTGQT